MTREELLSAARRYVDVLLDIGTGDGKFVYRWAAEHPATFCIGLDANADNLQEISAKAGKKPARGGISNTLFVVASVEDVPEELRRTADTITINYPWGSLLTALVKPDEGILRSIAGLAKESARFVWLLNYSVFQNTEHSQKLGLPELDEHYLHSVLFPKYRESGFDVQRHEFLTKEPPHRTSWGQSLTLGSVRETIMLEGVVNPAEPISD